MCSSVSMAETLICCLKHDHCNQSSDLRAPAGRYLLKDRSIDTRTTVVNVDSVS